MLWGLRSPYTQGFALADMKTKQRKIVIFKSWILTTCYSMTLSWCSINWLLFWLLVAPCLSVPGVSIYCSWFKGDCRRTQSMCCLFLDKTTPAPTTSTTVSITDSLEEYVDQLEFSDGGDPLDAQPSYVQEVFVKPPWSTWICWQNLKIYRLQLQTSYQLGQNGSCLLQRNHELTKLFLIRQKKIPIGIFLPNWSVIFQMCSNWSKLD